MIKIENEEVIGWEHAIRGMRNPMNSWDKSDSYYTDNTGTDCPCDCPYGFTVGPNDLSLMKRLRQAGTDHRKFMRMITVYADINAPLYWWKEYDTYKVGTVANSCSTMHKIQAKEFTLDDFSHEQLEGLYLQNLEQTIHLLNEARKGYIEQTKGLTPTAIYKNTCYGTAKQYWWQMIQLLPSSYNQKRTVMLNYEVLANMYKSRKSHKLDEWVDFCKWIETLPYSEVITGELS